MSFLTSLDARLLSAAQWVVDKIGGDYLGQRIARQLANAIYGGLIVLNLADYRADGVTLIFSCTIWAANLCAIYCWVNQAMRALHRGFANPARENLFLRFYFLTLSICLLPLVIISWKDSIIFARGVLIFVQPAIAYFNATDNPPPKKVKKTADEKVDVSSLKSAPILP